MENTITYKPSVNYTIIGFLLFGTSIFLISLIAIGVLWVSLMGALFVIYFLYSCFSTRYIIKGKQLKVFTGIHQKKINIDEIESVEAEKDWRNSSFANYGIRLNLKNAKSVKISPEKQRSLVACLMERNPSIAIKI